MRASRAAGRRIAAADRRRRAHGLRTEEIAALAGVSLTWYSALESGKGVRVSANMLERVATALRLSPEERDFLTTLARQSPPAPRSMRTPCCKQSWTVSRQARRSSRTGFGISARTMRGQMRSTALPRRRKVICWCACSRSRLYATFMKIGRASRGRWLKFSICRSACAGRRGGHRTRRSPTLSERGVCRMVGKLRVTALCADAGGPPASDDGQARIHVYQFRRCRNEPGCEGAPHRPPAARRHRNGRAAARLTYRSAPRVTSAMDRRCSDGEPAKIIAAVSSAERFRRCRAHLPIEDRENRLSPTSTSQRRFAPAAIAQAYRSLS